MTVPVLRGNVVSAVEPLVEALIERVTDLPDITLGHLMEKIVGLLGEQVVRDFPDACIMLEGKLTQIDSRNREEPVGLNEQRFYNLSSDLIDTAGRINIWCVERLREINLGEGAQDEIAFRVYQSEVRERLILQRIGKILGTFNYDKAATDILGMRSMEHFQKFLSTEVDSLHLLPLAQALIKHDKVRAEKLISIYFPSFRVPVPKIAFGKDAWEKYYGSIEQEPSLPIDIFEKLEEPCPYFSGKVVSETHLLVLIPKTVNGEDLTLNTFRELVRKHQGRGLSGQYREYWPPAEKELGNCTISDPYWLLITKEVIPGSRSHTFGDQCLLLKKSYRVPRVLELVIGILTDHVKNGMVLYPESPPTYSRCQEQVQSRRMTVGSFGISGLNIYLNSGDDARVIDHCALGGVKEL